MEWNEHTDKQRTSITHTATQKEKRKIPACTPGKNEEEIKDSHRKSPGERFIPCSIFFNFFSNYFFRKRKIMEKLKKFEIIFVQ